MTMLSIGCRLKAFKKIKMIKKMGMQQTHNVLIIDCRSEVGRLAVLKWWCSMTAKEMTDCIKTKVKLFYARSNALNKKTSKELQMWLRRILAGMNIVVTCSKETVYVGTVEDEGISRGRG